MSILHYAIVGNGAAGNRAAQVLREGDGEAKISLISAEQTHYLHRHRLAGFLARGGDLESLAVHPWTWYEEKGIHLRLNQPVVQVDPGNKQLLLAHRERIEYDKLLICSGARHRMPEYLSHFEKRIRRFSHARDAILLRKRIDDIEHLTLIGGDCVGLQLLGALLPAGKRVTLIMDDYRFWPLELDEGARKRLSAALARTGLTVIRDDFVVDVQEKGEGLHIETERGERFDTDEAIVCSGLVPCLEFLSDSGIAMQRGILTNTRLETSAPDVWAAGEVAEIYHEEIKDYRCSTGYANAVTQGEIAARNMLGGDAGAALCEAGEVVVAGERFIAYGWKGLILDAAG